MRVPISWLKEYVDIPLSIEELAERMTLAGLFTPEGTSWTDSAGDPNQVGGWSATFTVYDSYPRLNDKSGLVRVFEDAGWGRI